MDGYFGGVCGLSRRLFSKYFDPDKNEGRLGVRGKCGLSFPNTGDDVEIFRQFNSRGGDYGKDSTGVPKDDVNVVVFLT